MRCKKLEISGYEIELTQLRTWSATMAFTRNVLVQTLVVVVAAAAAAAVLVILILILIFILIFILILILILTLIRPRHDG